MTMIDLLRIMKEELDEAAQKKKGQNAKARLEVSPQRKARGKSTSQVFLAFVCETSDILVGGETAAKCSREVEGHADEGWIIDMHVVSKICAFLNDAVFETVVKSVTPDPNGWAMGRA